MMLQRIVGNRGVSSRVVQLIQRNASTATAVTYQKNGDPKAVLKKEDLKLPSVSADSVKVKMLAAPINPADINMVSGSYGITADLPAVGGNEGVGIVEEVGSGVKSVSKGDWVIPATPGLGTWRTHAVWKESQVLPVSNSLPVEYAATISVNPCTAYRLLADFADLQEGDVVIQNGANSSVGQLVIQLAARKGVKTINVIRQRPNFDETVEKLKALGGTIVVGEDYVRTPEYKRLVADLPEPKLALNCVGGESATNLARCLGNGGTMVTYGGMSLKPVVIPTSLAIFKNVTTKGFWISKWNETASKEDRIQMLSELTGMLCEKPSQPSDAGTVQPDYSNVKGGLNVWIERKKLNDFESALEVATSPYKERKIVLTME